MSLSAIVGDFTMPVITGNHSVTGLGFQPKVIIFKVMGFGGGGTNIHVEHSFGWAISASQERSMCWYSQNGQSTSYARRGWSDTYCIHCYQVGTSATLSFAANFVSMDSDGFTINIATAPPSGYRIEYLALGGSDITNLDEDRFDLTTSTSDQSVTGVGFQPDFLLVMSTLGTTNSDFSSGDITNGIGFASGTSNQATMSWSEDTGLSTTDANRYQRTDSVLALLDGPGTEDFRVSLKSFDSDGFTLQKDNAPPSNRRLHFLAIKGGEWYVSNFLSRTSTGSFSETGVGFQPKSMLLASFLNPASTSPQANCKNSFGMASSSSARNSSGFRIKDSASTTDNFMFQYSNNIYNDWNDTGTVREGYIDFTSFDTDGFTLNQQDADPTANQIIYFAVGDTASTPLVIEPTGIPSEEAFGSHTVSTGSVTIRPTGIPSGEAFGSHTVSIGMTIRPTGIPSGEAFGSHVVKVGEIPTVFEITEDEYFVRKQPGKSEEIKNRVEVETQPLLPVSVEEDLFETEEVIELADGESKTVTAYYSSQPAMVDSPLDPTLTKEDEVGGTLTIDSVTFYAWGATIRLRNTSGSTGSCNLLITGYPLEVIGSEVAIAEDEDSQEDFGLQKYVFPKNHLIQSESVAQAIADKLLESYKTYRKDVTVTWRGNPVLVLGDQFDLPEYRRPPLKVIGTFKVTKNKLNYDGTLKEITDGRKIGSRTEIDSILTLTDTETAYGRYISCIHDGYLISATSPGNIFAGSISVDGEYTNIDSDNSQTDFLSLYSDGSYIYAGHSKLNPGISVWTFDGSALSLVDFYSLPTDIEVRDIIADGSDIYWTQFDSGVLGTGSINKGTLSGGTISFDFAYGSLTGKPYACALDSVNNRIFVSETFTGIKAFSIGASSFTLLSTLVDHTKVEGMVYSDLYLYMADLDDGLRIYTFDGSSFTLVATLDSSNYDDARDVQLDVTNDYVFTGCDNKLNVALFEAGGSLTHLESHEYAANKISNSADFLTTCDRTYLRIYTIN